MPITIINNKRGVQMINGFTPNYDLEARIQHTKLDSWGSIPSARMNRVEELYL